VAALGINLPVLVAQLVNFLILLAFFGLVALPFLTKMLDKRAAKIKESMELAEQVKQQTLQAEERMKAQLDAARQDGQKILAQAEQVGERLKEEAKAAARREAEAILARAQVETKMDRDRAIDDLRKEVVDIAILAAEKVVHESLDKAAYRRLIDEVVKDSGALKKVG
jgi:F-type H+-transporting ATPase subunit b